MTEALEIVTPGDLEARLEALLFAAAGPVTPSQLAEALQLDIETVQAGIHELEAEYFLERGLRIQRYAGKIQLTTAPEYAEPIEKLLGIEATSRLSRAALETLAIIAYRQPITRPGIDAIRGVNSDGVLKSILNKGLIQEVGRADGPGRPILYSITVEFLEHFGLSSTDELPPLELPSVDEAQNEEKPLLKD
jgi:segregation and condensation protein B